MKPKSTGPGPASPLKAPPPPSHAPRGNSPGQRLLLMLMAALGAGMLFLASPGKGVPQPLLSIVHEGSNQFTITMSKSVSTNYTLQWTPDLAVESDEWISLWGVEGTNTTLTAEGLAGWFRVLVGVDGDADGIPPWMDANDNDPNIGGLTVTIDSPWNGQVLE